MHSSIKNLIDIKNQIKSQIKDSNNKDFIPNIIAVSKTFSMDHILPLIEYGHMHFGENKIQEAISKWQNVKEKNANLKLHLIGKLQTNKVKFALMLFDYIHSLDSRKLADKISVEQKKINKKPKIFIQINIGNEIQKNGINPEYLEDFYKYCVTLNLNVVGTMCIPPLNDDSVKYFMRMRYLNDKFNFRELSMGMSSDYLDAVKNGATYLRIGSGIFGQRN